MKEELGRERRSQRLFLYPQSGVSANDSDEIESAQQSIMKFQYQSE